MNVGIFGGGQLAKMIMLEGYKMGLRFNVYDPNDKAVSSYLSNEFFNYEFLDEKKIDEFFNINDVFTYEFENVEPSYLAKHTKKIPQGIEALKILQDRFLEKQFINSLSGVTTAKFWLGNDVENITYPCIVKTRRNGYDGKGQKFVKTKDELPSIDVNYVVEEFVEDIIEYSIIIGRNKNGKTYVYDPINNLHKKGILYRSTFAKNIDTEVKEKMIFKSKKIIEKLDYYGVLCVEFFVKEGNVYVNEVAPRVHNSGHMTIEASNISQFKLHLHCILGIPVPDIECYEDYFMINILGHDLEECEKMMIDEEFRNVNYHIYGKDSYVKNRKVGHMTFKGNDLLDKITKRVVGGVN